jgi:hypothetical protein
MTQTTWENGRRYLCGGREFLYYTDALNYARYMFKLSRIVLGIESIYNTGESK